MAAYDISASRSDSNSQGANQSAGTMINFGNNANMQEWLGGQSAQPESTAVAARNAGPVLTGDGAGVSSAPTLAEKIFGPGREPNWPMIGAAVLAVAAIGGAIYYATRKG